MHDIVSGPDNSNVRYFIGSCSPDGIFISAMKFILSPIVGAELSNVKLNVKPCAGLDKINIVMINTAVSAEKTFVFMFIFVLCRYLNFTLCRNYIMVIKRKV